jgi:hypothetical protein
MAAIMRFFIGKFQAFQSCQVMSGRFTWVIPHGMRRISNEYFMNQRPSSVISIVFDKPLKGCQHGYVPPTNFSASGEAQYGIPTPCNEDDEMADKRRRAV